MTDRPGLRERKRRATENAIEEAAVRLALERGAKAVTVEAICADADISRSTFFNYFPGRDAAIFGRPVEIAATERTERILDDNAADPVLGAFLVGIDAIGARAVNTEVARGRERLLADDPELAHHYSGGISRLEQQLTAVLVDWLARHPDRARLDDPVSEAALLVGVVAAAGRGLMLRFLAGEGDMAVDPEAFCAEVARLRTVLSSGD